MRGGAQRLPAENGVVYSALIPDKRGGEVSGFTVLRVQMGSLSV